MFYTHKHAHCLFLKKKTLDFELRGSNLATVEKFVSQATGECYGFCLNVNQI